MFFTVLIAFIGLIFLLVLHEFGHFVFAKLFNVKVEEFGVGYPPRIFGKKIGETVYSLNFLPFGAFVKLPGEIERTEDHRSFSIQPLWKRVIIACGGVFSFWIIAAIILSIVITLGAPTAISDEETKGLINPKVQIAVIVPDSPAAEAGLKIGDTITSLKSKIKNEKLKITTVKEVQDFTEINKGE